MAEQKRRGRPRSAQAEAAILKAARELLDDAGPARLTIEAVAARAKVGKPTIYRYWANARELAMAALMARMPDAPGVVESQSALADLRTHVRGLIARFSTTRGKQTALMLATAERDSEMFKAFRNQVVMTGREEGRAILARAQMSGEVRADLPIETTLDLIYGPIFFRLLTVHAPLTQSFADEIVGLISSGIREPD
ncbi:TetR/AcrR family transcriptional regulator [Pyruvatibacter sp. HU-CL02332]|uniref:TetR/AcrR family transcriptional regulator n=1 Tax=Pyruvatibacter sp. HU-CL02332 TaxID=3127650 RepID=UPI0031081229